RGLAEALVRPYAAKLDQRTAGAGYLRVLSDLVNSPTPSPAAWDAGIPNGSMTRWRAMLEPLLDPQAVALHRRFHTVRFVISELAQRSRAEDRTQHELFISQLIDSVVGLLSAEVSGETRRLLETPRSHR